MELMDYKSTQYKSASCCQSGKTWTGFPRPTEPETAECAENKSIFLFYLSHMKRKRR